MSTKQSEITPEKKVASIKQMPVDLKRGGIVGVIRRAISAAVLDAESHHGCVLPFWMVIRDQAEAHPAYTLYVDEQRRLYGETPKLFCCPADVVIDDANGKRVTVVAMHQTVN